MRAAGAARVVIWTFVPSIISLYHPSPSLSIAHKKSVRRKAYLWKRTNKQAMEENLAKLTEKFTKDIPTSTPVNVLWNGFRERCIESVDTFVPYKLTSMRFSQAWRNRGIRRFSRRKKRSFRKAHATTKQADLYRYKKIQKETQQVCRSVHDDVYINSMVSEPGSNSKTLFSCTPDNKYLSCVYGVDRKICHEGH